MQTLYLLLSDNSIQTVMANTIMDTPLKCDGLDVVAAGGSMEVMERVRDVIRAPEDYSVGLEKDLSIVG